MKRHWLALTAGLVAFLVAVGGGAAYALWAVTAQKDLDATAAETGIVSTEPADLDTVHYTWNPVTEVGTVMSVGKVTVENTGNREATAQVTVTLLSTDHDSGELYTPGYKSSLGELLKVRYTLLADPEDACTVGSYPASGLNLGAGHDYAAASSAPVGNGPVTALVDDGDEVTFCVEVWLAGPDQSSFGPGEFELQIAPSLKYADGANWTATDTHEVTQTIAAPPEEQFFTLPAARYNARILQTNGTTWGCVHMNAAQPLIEHTGSPNNCAANNSSDYNREYRIVRVTGTNKFWIQWATNSNIDSQPTEPRWTAVDGLVDSVSASDTNLAMQWFIVKNISDGTFQVRSADTGECIQAATGVLTGEDVNGWSGNYRMTLAECDSEENLQKFSFPIKGNPYAYVQMTCGSGTGWTSGQNVVYNTTSFYTNEAIYRVYVDGVINYDPVDPTLPPTRNGGTHLGTSNASPAYGYKSGTQNVVQLYSWQSWYAALSSDTGGSGTATHKIIVEQKLPFADWYVVAYVDIEKRASDGQYRCL